MNQKLGFVAVVLSTLVLSACHDPNAADESNFGAALSKHFNSQGDSQLCIGLMIDAETHSFDVAPSPYGKAWDSTYASLYKLLADKGILTTTSVEIVAKSLFGSEKQVQATRYTVSDVALQDLKARKSGMTRSNTGNEDICFGSYELIEVTRFSKPSEAFGKTLSEVWYTYRFADIPQWALDPELNGGARAFAKAQAAKHDGKATMVLMSDGWTHSNDLH